MSLWLLNSRVNGIPNKYELFGYFDINHMTDASINHMIDESLNNIV